ncbi:hypothetical protein [Burkholderia multivorans]
MKTYAILTSGPRLDASKAIVDAVAFSCCNYAVFALPIYGMYRGAWATQHAIAYAVVWCQRRLKTDPFVGARAEVNLTPWG